MYNSVKGMHPYRNYIYLLKLFATLFNAIVVIWAMHCERTKWAIIQHDIPSDLWYYNSSDNNIVAMNERDTTGT